MANVFFDGFYAKSDGETTLEMHTRHVLTAGMHLIERLSLTETEKSCWKEKLHRMIVFHDLGKIHQHFVARLNGIRVSIRHELISVMLCESFLELEKDELFAIATHHRGVINSFSDMNGTLDVEQVASLPEQWYEADQEIFSRIIVEEWQKLFGLSLTIMNNPKPSISMECQKILNVQYQPRIISDIEQRKQLSLSRAFLMAADHLGSARKEEDIPEYKLLRPIDFQPTKEGKYLSFRPFQKKLQEVKGDAILHAPTGSGKTEAAMSWVLANQTKNARIFYLLPYTASINAMVQRLQVYYRKDLVTAVHSKTLDFFYDQAAAEVSNLNKNYMELEKEARNKKSLSKELFYPVKVATLHQVLKTSLKGKGWEFSLLDYKNALFIIDEFHTYDALLTGMLLASIKLFRKLFDAKFLFLSATIPDFMKRIIICEVFEGNESRLIYPDKSLEGDKEILNKRRHLLITKSNEKITDQINLIKKYMDDGRSVLIIVNNVKTAQDVFELVGEYSSARMLHGGFNQRDRIEIEKEITHQEVALRPKLLIATQAVEVSLDIDYDVAFIENAPIDALIQRFGRVNRAGKKFFSPIEQSAQQDFSTVPVYLFENSVGKTPFYDTEILALTWEELLERDTLEIGEDELIEMCNSVYKDGYNETQEKDFQIGLKNSIIQSFEKDWIAGNWRNWVDDILDKGTQKIDVLCENLVDEYIKMKKENRYIEANQLLVSVYGYGAEIYTMKDVGDVKIARNLQYDERVGFLQQKPLVEDQFL